MTRVSVYLGLMAVSVAATAMTVASITLPRWAEYTATTPAGDRVVSETVGLHRRCAPAADPPCATFPSDEQCAGAGLAFCHAWRSAGFLANFAVALHLVVLVACVVLVNGGKRRRETGWRVLGALLAGTAAVEFVIIGIVSYLLENHERFALPGWSLDKSWVLCATSAGLTAGSAGALAASSYLLPPEGGYEFLDDSIEASHISEWLSSQG